MKIIICSNENNKFYKLYQNERYLTDTLKNIKERNIKISKKMNCDDFELRIIEDNQKVLKIYNYFPTFKKLYKYFPIKQKTNINYSLYSNDNPESSIDVGFKDKETAIKSIEKIKKKPLGYQIKVITTLFNRAKFHPHQTKEMKDAMKIFKKWLKDYSLQ